MPRKKKRKPRGYDGLCWAWRAHKKALGQRLEAAGDQAGADACRCHRRANAQTGRCKYHGGTSRRGPTHHAYKHGRFSALFVGILAPAREAYEAVAELSTLRSELAISSAFLTNKLREILVGGPSDEAWIELGRMTDEIERVLDAGDRKAMVALLNERDALIKTQRSSAVARGEASDLIERHRKVVDTEARRQDRHDLTVSMITFMAFIQAMAEAVRDYVTNPTDRAAVAKAFDRLIARAHLPDLADADGRDTIH